MKQNQTNIKHKRT